MKYCKYCNTQKLEEDFHKNPSKKDGLSDRCKECRKIYHKEHYDKNKEKYIKKAEIYRKKSEESLIDLKKTLTCEQCGESRYWVLDFHHINPEEKDLPVSTLVRFGNKKRLEKEIEKCTVLCSNCHRDLHHKEKHAE